MGHAFNTDTAWHLIWYGRRQICVNWHLARTVGIIIYIALFLSMLEFRLLYFRLHWILTCIGFLTALDSYLHLIPYIGFGTDFVLGPRYLEKDISTTHLACYASHLHPFNMTCTFTSSLPWTSMAIYVGFAKGIQIAINRSAVYGSRGICNLHLTTNV